MGDQVVTVHDDGGVWVWNPVSGEHRQLGSTASGPAGIVTVGDQVVTVHDDGGVWVWDPASGEHRQLGSTASAPTGIVTVGDQVVTVREDGGVWVWYPLDLEPVKIQLQGGVELLNAYGSMISVISDGNLVVIDVGGGS